MALGKVCAYAGDLGGKCVGREMEVDGGDVIFASDVIRDSWLADVEDELEGE